MLDTEERTDAPATEPASAEPQTEGEPSADTGTQWVYREVRVRIATEVADQLVRELEAGQSVSTIPAEGALAASILRGLRVPDGQLHAESGVKAGRHGKAYAYEYVTITAAPPAKPVKPKSEMDQLGAITRAARQHTKAGKSQREAFMLAASEAGWSEDRAARAFSALFE